MKKILFLLTILFVGFTSFAQSPEFMGVPIDGNKDNFVNVMKTKGFILSNDNDVKNTYVSMEGIVNGKSMELLIAFTPTTKIVWKVIVSLSKQSDWSSLKSEYEKYKEIITKKYGEPKDSFHFFSSPYDEGDGYEMTGVAVGKSHYSSYYDYNGNSIAVEITKWKEVNIGYENEKNRLIKNKEKELLDNKTF